MARVSKVDPCLICEQLPCECNKPAPKPRLPRASKKSTEAPKSAPAPVATKPATAPSMPRRPDALAAMKARAVPTPPPPTRAERNTGGRSGDTFASAVGALWDILHPDEKIKYAQYKPSPLDRRREAWKAKVRT